MYSKPVRTTTSTQTPTREHAIAMGNLLSSTAAAVRRSNTEDSDAYRGGSSGGEGAYRLV